MNACPRCSRDKGPLYDKDEPCMDCTEKESLRADRDALAEKLRRVEGERDRALAMDAKSNNQINDMHRETASLRTQLRELGEQLEGAKHRDEINFSQIRVMAKERAALQQQVGEADKLAEALEFLMIGYKGHYAGRPDTNCYDTAEATLTAYRSARHGEGRT